MRRIVAAINELQPKEPAQGRASVGTAARLLDHSGGKRVSGIVGVARGAWGVERVWIWRGQRQAMPDPVHEIRVGDERRSEGDRVGLASGESIAATPLIVTAIFNKGPFIGVADEGRTGAMPFSGFDSRIWR